LQAQADWLLDVLAQMHASGPSLQDGSRIQLGWSILQLKRRLYTGELVVCEPDFTRNPFTDVVEEVTSTLRTLVQQNDLAQRAGAQPVQISFQDKIVLTKGCLEHDAICLQRGEVHPEKGDSGWFIGPQGDRAESPELEAIYAYELVSRRPKLAAALALPSGYMVMASGENIQTVINASDEVVLQSE
jgi:hypothetical protein